jgi:pimeloyl-ACP methyl ester carboxylesterase
VASLLLNGIDLHFEERGAGRAVLLLHETASSGRVWDQLLAALGGEVRALAPDRRGWGATGAPQGYVATTIEEQAEDAAALLRALAVEEALICGAGLGAVIALDLLLRHPRLAGGAVLVEPPLLALLPEATEEISADRAAIESAMRDGGPRGVLDLYLAGGLRALGPGADRLPDAATGSAREHPLSLFAELAAVPAWRFRGNELLSLAKPSRIVVSSSTPSLLRRAGQELADRLGGSPLRSLETQGLPHVDAAAELAAAIRALLSE